MISYSRFAFLALIAMLVQGSVSAAPFFPDVDPFAVSQPRAGAGETDTERVPYFFLGSLAWGSFH